MPSESVRDVDDSSSSETLSIVNDDELVQQNGRKSYLTKLDSFHQMFCYCFGASFFLAPFYLKDVGIVPGIVFGVFAALSYLYTSHLYFWCESRLRECSPSAPSVTTIYELVEQIFVRIVKRPTLAAFLRTYLKYEVVLSWVLSLAVVLLFISKNIQLIFRNYDYDISEAQAVLFVFLSLVSLVLVSDLGTLRIIFYVSSVSVVIVIVETLIYIFVADDYPVPEMRFFGSARAIPTFINNVQLTIATPPLLFLYKKEMKRGEDLTALCGSLNQSVGLATVIMIIYALACSIRFGDELSENIIGNLPNTLLVNVISVLMTLNLILIEPINFYGLFTYLWDGTPLHGRFESSNRIASKCYQSAAKIVVYILPIATTFLIPSLSRLIDLIGCLTIMNDIITLPVVLETIMVWKCSGSEREKWCTLLRNSLILILTVAYCTYTMVNSVIQHE